MNRRLIVIVLAASVLAGVLAASRHAGPDVSADDRPTPGTKASAAPASSGIRDGRHCDADWVCIEPLQRGDRIEFVASVLRDVPVTVTLALYERPGQRRASRAITASLPPLGTEMLTSQRSRDGARPHYRLEWTVGSLDPDHDDGHVYRLPYESGRGFTVLQGYGSGFSHNGLEHYAVDFDMPEGTPVLAARAGRVARVEESHDIGCWSDGCADYANFVVILHDDGTTGEYYHLQKDGSLVAEGEFVAAGQPIARSGNTGHTTMPHLHFAVYRAASWGNTQSLPVRFAGMHGIIDEPRQGGRYVAP